MPSRIVYREHAPRPSLAGVVRCFWTNQTTSSQSEPSSHVVFPDACMDWLFDFSAARGAGVRVIGTMSRAQKVLQLGKIDLLGVRFHPCGMSAVLNFEAKDLLDTSEDLSHFIGYQAEELWEQLAEASQMRRLGLLQDELERRCSRAPDPFVVHCTSRLENCAGSLRISSLESGTGLSTRQIERKFVQHLGLGPKTFARISRFKMTVSRLDAGISGDWARFASELGYADQAHLIREFKTFSGHTPAAYLAQAR